ncbi:MAG: LysR family transcriptional regulator [Paracoccaceae bacterium]|nr:LysR family transcriptional regulator [Paracoccaceae bacterium]
MRRRLPPLNALLAFDAAARHQSFTLAAREMGIAQPAITRHIGNLETWLGAPLFERRGNSVALTEAGVHLARVATSAFDRIELGVRDLPRGGRQDLIIGASFGITHLWLMPRLAAMRAATTATVNFMTSDAYSDFDRAGVDLSIRYGDGRFPGYLSDLLLPEICFVVASPGFMAAHPELDPRDLTGSLRGDWLLEHGDPSDTGWVTWRTWFEAQGVPPPQPERWTEIRTYPALLDMVRHGEGLAIGHVGLDDQLVESGEILRLGSPLQRPGRGYFLVYGPEAMKRPGFRELRAQLLDRAG